MLGTIGLAGAFSFFSNKILSCGEGGLLATHDDEVAAFARSRRSHAMTSGTWDRHRGRSLGYDVVGLGYNYRMDEPRAALLSTRLPGLRADIEARRAVMNAATASCSPGRRARAAVHRRGGWAELLLRDAGDAARPYAARPAARCWRRSTVFELTVLYPSISQFESAYESSAAPLPRCEHAGATQLTLPLYPHLGDERQDRVIEALRVSLKALTAHDRHAFACAGRLGRQCGDPGRERRDRTPRGSQGVTAMVATPRIRDDFGLADRRASIA